MTDFSLAWINAAVLAFNNKTLITYLNECYNIISCHQNVADQSKLIPEGCTPFYLCIAHLMKNFCKDVDKSNVKQIFFIKDAFASIAMCTKLAQIEDKLYSLYVLLNSKFKSEAVIESIQKLSTSDNSTQLIVQSATVVTTVGVIDETLYKNNLFYLHMNKYISENPIFDDSKIVSENYFYDSGLFQAILKKYVPYIPM